MAPILRALVGSGHAAVLTMELQQGVVGPGSSFPELAAAVGAGEVLHHAGRLLGAAREARVPVVHCTAGFRADRRGSARNCPLTGALLRRPDHMVLGTDGVQLMPELAVAEDDLISDRHNGVSPFAGTDLDVTLRSLEVTTVIAVGVSLNVAMPGLAIEAVNLGYRVVIPRDAVAGVPVEYGEAVLTHTLALLATITSVDEVTGVWIGADSQAFAPRSPS
jgi:nicotinamidase-related amidase